MEKFSVIITGATGMVGEGVLHVCLGHESIERVLVINRRPCGVTHPKLTEIVHSNFFDITPLRRELSGYDACLFCLGVSSVGMKEEKYFKLTHTLTLHVAGVLVEQNPAMSFYYVSGAGTDSSEKGRLMWARVKGKTENDLMKLPFRQVVAYRPAFIKPIKGLRHVHKAYYLIGWLFPIGRALSKNGFCTLRELALSMIRMLPSAETRKIMEGKDIIAMGR